MNLKCKYCGGFVYEEEIFYEVDEDNSDRMTKIMQIDCMHCSRKRYIKYKDWLAFKEGLSKAIRIRK